eukprot:1342141-Amphidinium_carterae.1
MLCQSDAFENLPSQNLSSQIPEPGHQTLLIALVGHLLVVRRDAAEVPHPHPLAVTEAQLNREEGVEHNVEN